MTGVTQECCPSCLTGTATETGREPLESDLKRTFECGACGHVWNVLS